MKNKLIFIISMSFFLVIQLFLIYLYRFNPFIFFSLISFLLISLFLSLNYLFKNDSRIINSKWYQHFDSKIKEIINNNSLFFILLIGFLIFLTFFLLLFVWDFVFGSISSVFKRLELLNLGDFFMYFLFVLGKNDFDLLNFLLLFDLSLLGYIWITLFVSKKYFNFIKLYNLFLILLVFWIILLVLNSYDINVLNIMNHAHAMKNDSGDVIRVIDLEKSFDNMRIVNSSNLKDSHLLNDTLQSKAHLVSSLDGNEMGVCYNSLDELQHFYQKQNIYQTSSYVKAYGADTFVRNVHNNQVEMFIDSNDNKKYCLFLQRFLE